MSLLPLHNMTGYRYICYSTSPSFLWQQKTMQWYLLAFSDCSVENCSLLKSMWRSCYKTHSCCNWWARRGKSWIDHHMLTNGQQWWLYGDWCDTNPIQFAVSLSALQRTFCLHLTNKFLIGNGSNVMIAFGFFFSFCGKQSKLPYHAHMDWWCWVDTCDLNHQPTHLNLSILIVFRDVAK